MPDKSSGHRLPDISALIAIAIGAIVLSGWWISDSATTAFLPGVPRMRPNAALEFIVAGLSTWCLKEVNGIGYRKLAGRALGFFTLLVGTSTCFEYMLHFDLHIDRLALLGAQTVAYPGAAIRMWPYTALSFSWLGGALICLSFEAGTLAQYFAAASLIGSFFSFLSYNYNADALYHARMTDIIPPHSALAMIALSLGVLWARPSAGFLRLFGPGKPGALVSRRLIPIAIFAPTFLGAISVIGLHRGLYAPETGIAILATWTSVAFAGGTIVIARELRKRDSERSAITTELQEREARLRGLFNQITDGILTMDEQGVIEGVNPALEQLFGHSASDLQGRHLSLLIPAFSRQEPARIIGEGCKFRARRKSGDFFSLELSLSAWISGGQRMFCAIMRDISDREKSEVIEHRLAAIVQSSSDAIVGKTLDGIVTSWNRRAEELFGYSAEEMIGAPIFRIIPAEREQELIEILGRIRNGERIEHHETERITKDGRRISVSLSISPIFDGEGKVTGASKIAHDVTNQKRMEEGLRQSQKMDAIGQLAGGIAHDFNNLLTVVNGYASLALETMSEGAPHYRAFQQILASGQLGAALTQHLLAFSRKQLLQVKVVDLNETFAEVSPLLQRLVRENIRFGMNLDPQPVMVKADPHQLEQVLMNLVINACDAMPRGGSLTIETRRTVIDEEKSRMVGDIGPGCYALISITDTGIGMSAEVKSHVFEPFFTTKGKGAGTGLGLATVFGIVKQSDGHIDVYSEPNAGTTFRIYLPSTEEPAANLAVTSEVRSLQGKETLLLVEDDDRLRDYARSVLSGFGYTVYEAADGIEAMIIAEARAGEIDLIISDVIMPNVGGADLATRLRERLPNVRILFVSGYTENSISHEGTLLPDFEFLAKPFTPGQLGLKVRQLLELPGVYVR